MFVYLEKRFVFSIKCQILVYYIYVHFRFPTLEVLRLALLHGFGMVARNKPSQIPILLVLHFLQMQTWRKEACC